MQINDRVKVTSVQHYPELLGCVGVITKLNGLSWCGDNPISVQLYDQNNKLRTLGFNKNQLELYDK